MRAPNIPEQRALVNALVDARESGANSSNWEILSCCRRAMICCKNHSGAVLQYGHGPKTKEKSCSGSSGNVFFFLSDRSSPYFVYSIHRKNKRCNQASTPRLVNKRRKPRTKPREKRRLSKEKQLRYLMLPTQKTVIFLRAMSRNSVMLSAFYALWIQKQLQCEECDHPFTCMA